MKIYAQLILVLFLAVSTDTQADTRTSHNIAYGRQYELSPAPNYPGGSDQSRQLLTDGVKTGRRWAPSDIAGWSRAAPVVITLDLSQTGSFNAITYSAHANQRGELYHPAQAFIYAGPSAQSQKFIGSLANNEAEKSATGAGTFEISFESISARFVTMVIYPRGDYLILDEIIVRSSPAGVEISGDLSAGKIRSDAKDRRRAYALQVNPVPQGTSPSRRWAAPLRGAATNSGAACEIKRVKPWASVSLDTLQDIPDDEASIVRTSTMAPARTAWLITNSSDAEIMIGARAQSESAEAKAISFVQTLNYAWVPDAPIRFEEGSLPARSAMLILADFFGAIQSAQMLFSCGGISVEKSVPVLDVRIKSIHPPLHGTLWPYLRGPASTLSCQQDILAISGSDTAVLPPSALNKNINAQAEHELRRYLRAFRSAARIHLFMDLTRNEWRKGEFASERWPSAFANWWSNIRTIAQEEGYAGELLLYPYDEISPENVIALFKFRYLFRTLDPKARFFGTIDRRSSADAIKRLDVVQLLDKPDVMNLPAAERHIYATRGDARSLSPHEYYRLQGWKAYAHQYAGVGVWSLWESNGADDPASGWSPFGAEERDYAMAYRDEAGCLFPSRRLAAWMQGLDDYSLLKACEPVLGRGRLRDISRSVIGIASDVAAPDRALAYVAAACIAEINRDAEK